MTRKNRCSVRSAELEAGRGVCVATECVFVILVDVGSLRNG